MGKIYAILLCSCPATACNKTTFRNKAVPSVLLNKEELPEWQFYVCMCGRAYLRGRSPPNLARARPNYGSRKWSYRHLRTSPDDAISSRWNPPRTRLRSCANISRPACQIYTEFKLHVKDVGRYARSVSFNADDVGTGKIFLLISGIKLKFTSFEIQREKYNNSRWVCMQE